MKNEKDTQKGRLLKFINSLGMGRNEFEQSINISQGAVTRMNESRIGAIMLEQIYTTYPKLNLLWLLFGRGDMMLPDNMDIYDVSIGEKSKGALSVDHLYNENKDLKRDNEILRTKLDAQVEINEHLKTRLEYAEELLKIKKGR